MSNYAFAAVATTADVTNLLNNKKANKARVAAVGQEDAAKRFNVWYVKSSDHHDWNFSEVPFDKNTATDTDAVTAVLDKSDIAAVAFFGQAQRYYIWWLS